MNLVQHFPAGSLKKKGRYTLAAFLAAFCLAGCAPDDYIGQYRTTCPLEQPDYLSKIANEVARQLEVIPQTTGSSPPDIVLRLSASQGDARGDTYGEVEFYELNSTLAVYITRSSNGDDRLTQHLKEVVENILREHGCSHWEYKDSHVRFTFAK